jgi:hypothetical protein
VQQNGTLVRTDVNVVCFFVGVRSGRITEENGHDIPVGITKSATINGDWVVLNER